MEKTIEFSAISLLLPVFDVLKIVLDYLSDIDRIRFLSTCQKLHSIKCKVTYRKRVKISQIKDLFYYNQFTHIIATGKDLNDLKRSGKRLPSATNCLVLEEFRGYLRTHIKHLSSLTKLTLKKRCKITIKNNCLPSTISHLTWGTNQQISKKYLPKNLVSLRLVNYSGHIEPLTLPDGLISLTIGQDCIVSIDSSNLTRLKILAINCRCYALRMAYPNTIEKLIIGKHFQQWFSTFSIIIPGSFQIVPDNIKSLIVWNKDKTNLPSEFDNVITNSIVKHKPKDHINGKTNI